MSRHIFNSVDSSAIHRPTEFSERSRIEKLGGVIRKGRLNGKFAISRSIGDAAVKQPLAIENFMSSVPSIQVGKLSSSFEFFLLACEFSLIFLSIDLSVDLIVQVMDSGTLSALTMLLIL